MMLYVPGVLLPVMVRYIKLFTSKILSGTPTKKAIQQCVKEIESDTDSGEDSSSELDHREKSSGGHGAKSPVNGARPKRAENGNDKIDVKSTGVRKGMSPSRRREHASDSADGPASQKKYDLRRRA
jgi:hypothetical protein